MTRKRPPNRRREIRELREEIGRLRAELAAARTPALPLPGLPVDTSDLPIPIGACPACRWSGVCNCVRHDQVLSTYDPSLAACSPLDTTLRIAPGATRMALAPNANAGAGWPAVTIHDATGAAQPFTVHVENTTGCAPGLGAISIFP